MGVRIRVVATLACLLVARVSSESLDPLRHSLQRSEPQSIYIADPRDAWNRVFYLLFPRIENGDRAIDAVHLLTEPRYSRLLSALEDVRRTARSRPPLARALMQADLWYAYDMLHALTVVRDGPSTDEATQRQRYGQLLLPRLAMTMRGLALSRDEIAVLPETYFAAATTLGLPNVLDERTNWVEIRWLPRQAHDEAAGHRRAARVFVRPTEQPRGGHSATFDSVAALFQLLLVARDGTVVPSPITYDAQFGGAAARGSATDVPRYELNRRLMLSSPASGGLEPADAIAPADLPSVGDDLSSAERLITSRNVHAHDVARRKMEHDDFKMLRRQW